LNATQIVKSLEARRDDREPVQRAAKLLRGRLTSWRQMVQASVQSTKVFIVGESS
jgi:hypothetical protein